MFKNAFANKVTGVEQTQDKEKAHDNSGVERLGKEEPNKPEMGNSTLSVDVEEIGFEKSAARLEELRDGRGESDIPLNDAYWEYRNSHTLVHGKHAIRVDPLQLVKGKPVDKSKLEEE